MGQQANWATQPYDEPSLNNIPPQPYGGAFDLKQLARARKEPTQTFEKSSTQQSSEVSEDTNPYRPIGPSSNQSEQLTQNTPASSEGSNSSLAELSGYAGLSALGGVGLGHAAGWLDGMYVNDNNGQPTLSKTDAPMDKLVSKLKKIPGFQSIENRLNGFLESQSKKRGSWFRDILLTDAVVSQGASAYEQNQAVTNAMKNWRNTRIQNAQQAFQTLEKHQSVLSTLNGEDLLDKELITKISITPPGNIDIGEALDKDIETKVTQIKNRLKTETLSSQDKKALNAAKSALLDRRSTVLLGGTEVAQEALARQTAKMSSQGIGPIGRWLRASTTYLSRSINNESAAASLPLKEGGKAQRITNMASRSFGPILMGILTFVPAILDAKKADDGEKTSAFMRNVLGVGLGGGVGFEVGKRLIHGTGLINKMPYAQKVIIPVLKITAGRFVAGLGALLLFAPICQKIGEKLSDSIFGKPKSITSQESTIGKPSLPNVADVS